MSAENFASDPLICRQCRGLCCQGHPGLWTDPQAFFTRFFSEQLPEHDQLQTKLATLGLILRDVGGVAIPAPQATEAGCVFLAADGCTLPLARRPDQCLALTPSIDTLLDGEMRCSMPPEHGSGTARERWRSFWENL